MKLSSADRARLLNLIEAYETASVDAGAAYADVRVAGVMGDDGTDPHGRYAEALKRASAAMVHLRYVIHGWGA